MFRTMPERPTETRNGDTAGPVRTIIALFDDTIDAEHALTDLRRSDQPSAQISVILRERVTAPRPRSSRETLLSRVVAASRPSTRAAPAAAEMAPYVTWSQPRSRMQAASASRARIS